MRRKLMITIFCMIVLTGCWDRRELNTIGIVLGMGLDKDFKTGELILTIQVVRPGALQKQGSNDESPVEIVTAKGNTVFEAVKEMTLKFDRRGFFAHNKVIVIDEHLARDGIAPILDFIRRDHNMRNLQWIMVTKNVKARDVLGVKQGLENIQATYLEEMIKTKEANSKATTIDLLEFSKKYLACGINPIAGVAEIIEESNLPVEGKKETETKAIKLSGTAVFKKDKLVGYLDGIETRGLNWITGEVESGIIHVPSVADSEKEKLIAIEIKKASGEIKPEINNGKISFTITVKEEGDIGEQQGTTDVSNLEMFGKVEKEQIDAIEREIDKVISKAQKEFRSDIFGFGIAFSRKYPKEWNDIKDDWEDIFPKVQCRTEIDAQLRRTGLITKPIKLME